MASQEVINALEILHREIEKLEPAIKHIETAQQVTAAIKAIPDLHLKLLAEVHDHDVKHKNELSIIFEKEIEKYVQENSNLQNVTADIQHQVKLEQIALSKIVGSIESYYDRIEKINFPERLDKLDANVAGIMVAAQSIQSRLDGLERNIVDRLKDVQEFQKETRNLIQSDIKTSDEKTFAYLLKNSKQQQTLAVICYILIVACILLLFFLKN